VKTTYTRKQYMKTAILLVTIIEVFENNY